MIIIVVRASRDSMRPYAGTPNSVHKRAVFPCHEMIGVFLKDKSAAELIAIVLIYAQWLALRSH